MMKGAERKTKKQYVLYRLFTLRTVYTIIYTTTIYMTLQQYKYMSLKKAVPRP